MYIHTITPAHHAHTTDNYVHRLVQNKSDGKLVAVEGPGTVQGVSGAKREPAVCSRCLGLPPPLPLPPGGVRREAGLTSVGVHIPPHEPTGVPKGLLWGEADKSGDSGQWAGKHCACTTHQAVHIAWWDVVAMQQSNYYTYIYQYIPVYTSIYQYIPVPYFCYITYTKH